MARRMDIPKWRRLAMQVSMWVVLAGTVALAALVNREVGRTHGGELGPYISVDDIRIRLPLGWQITDETERLIEVTEPGSEQTGRVLSVKIVSPGLLGEVIRALTERPGDAIQMMEIPVGEESGTMLVRKRAVMDGLQRYYEVQVIVSANVPAGNRKLIITLQENGIGRKSEIEQNIDLVKRIAASVQFD